MKSYTSFYIRKRFSKKADSWQWQVCAKYLDENGKAHDTRKDTGIPCEPPSEDTRRARASVRATGKGSTKALAMLEDWKQGLLAAEEKAEEDKRAQAEHERRERERAERLTVWQCVEDFIETSRSHGFIEPSTAYDYQMCAVRIRRTLENVAVDDLTPEMLTQWQAGLSESHAHSTMKKTRNILRNAIQEAIDNNRTTLTKNPVITKRMTKSEKRLNIVTKAKNNALDLEGRTLLVAELDRMADTAATIGARIALFAGLREGEVCALQWRDIDFERGFISVNKSIAKSDRGGVYVKPQKNDAENRYVPLSPELGKALRRWKKGQAEKALLSGAQIERCFVIGSTQAEPQRECFEFQTATGRTDARERLTGNPDVHPIGAMNPDRISHEWKAIAQASMARGAGGAPVTFHNLRHTFASFCANEAGVEKERLARILGHADTKTTQKYYIRRDRELELEEDLEAMREAFSVGAFHGTPAEVVKYAPSGTEG